MTAEEKKLAHELPEHVWVNAWSSLNNEGQEVGISYCNVVYVPDETVSDSDPSPAREPVPEAITASRFQGGELQYTGVLQSEQTDQRSRETCLEPSADAAVTADPQGHVDDVVVTMDNTLDHYLDDPNGLGPAVKAEAKEEIKDDEKSEIKSEPEDLPEQEDPRIPSPGTDQAESPVVSPYVMSPYHDEEEIVACLPRPCPTVEEEDLVPCPTEVASPTELLSEPPSSGEEMAETPLEWLNPDQEREGEADYGGEDITATPLLSGNAVVELLAGGAPLEAIEERAAKYRLGLKLCFPDDYVTLDQVHLGRANRQSYGPSEGPTRVRRE